MAIQSGAKNFNLINSGKISRLQQDNGGPLIGGVLVQGGTLTLNGATPVTVVDAGVTANSVIILTLKTVGGTVSPTCPNVLTITPGTGFTVGGAAADVSQYNWVRIG